MKINRIKAIYLLTLFSLLITCPNIGLAQMVDDCIFLQGTRVEVGINAIGAFGSTVDAPSGYHNDVTQYFYDAVISPSSGESVNTLGFVADPDKDGWSVGVPNYFGDYFVPGDPQEGWALEIAGLSNYAYTPNFESGTTGVTGSTVSLSGGTVAFVNGGTYQEGIWQGSMGPLAITQITHLDTNKLYFTITVTLTATGGDADNVYYMRTLDPDNEEPETGSFVTDNTITYSLPDAENKVLVSATGTTYPSRSYLGLGTKDCRAMCFICNSGLTPSDAPDKIYSETGTGEKYSGTLTDDVGVGLVYNLGNIYAGESTQVSYAYILHEADIDSALLSTSPEFVIDTLAPSATMDTITTCGIGKDSLQVNILNGVFYNWSWAPATGLSSDSGTSNYIRLDSVLGGIVYTITGTSTSGLCAADTFYIVVLPGTINPILSNNGPLCSGNTLALTADSVSSTGTKYAWAGPAGYSSTLQDPVITDAAVSAGGVYTLNVTAGSCTATAYDSVLIYESPAVPNATGASVCAGTDIVLNVTDSVSGVSFAWTGPLGFSDTTKLDTVQINGSTVSESGVYTVTAANGKCSSTDTALVTISPMPLLPVVTTDAPICSGANLTISAVATPGATYSWSGPEGFSSSVSNPAISAADTGNTGEYVVLASLGICSTTDSAYAQVNLTPAVPVAANSGPICAGSALNLTSSDSTSGVSYSWSVSTSSYTSTQQNPIIDDAPTTASGVYTVTVSLGSCSSSTTTTAVVQVTPAIPSITGASPICSGTSLTLFASSDAGSTYGWTGPDSFSSGTETITINDAQVSNSGPYTVVASLGGCNSAPAVFVATVNQTPGLPSASDITYCRNAVSVPLTAMGDNLMWYTVDTGGTGTSLAPVPATGDVDTVTYYVSQVEDGCESGRTPLTVTIYPLPVVSVLPALDNSVCPWDTVQFNASGAMTYQWIPGMYLNDSTISNPISRPVTSLGYNVVGTDINGCTDTVAVNVTVRAAALLEVPDSVTIYPGESYTMDPSTNCMTFTWYPPTGLSADNISNPVAMPEVSTKYIVNGSTEYGCTAVDSIYVIVSEETLLAVPNAFAPGNGPNNELKVIRRGMATLKSFKIFNRWGNKVFETNDIDQGWDGNYNGSPQPLGVYIYEVEAYTSTGQRFYKQGNVTLLR